MNEYPIIFTFNEVIIVKKAIKAYLVMVESRGQALLVKENDKYWLNGVQPGGMSDGGNTAKEVLHNFRIAFRNVLSDIEEESHNYTDFHNRVSTFFNDVDDEELKRWEEARRKVKLGLVTPPEDFSFLKKESNELNNFIKIILLEKAIRITPYKNDVITNKIDKENFNSNTDSKFLAAA